MIAKIGNRMADKKSAKSINIENIREINNFSSAGYFPVVFFITGRPDYGGFFWTRPGLRGHGDGAEDAEYQRGRAVTAAKVDTKRLPFHPHHHAVQP